MKGRPKGTIRRDLDLPVCKCYLGNSDIEATAKAFSLSKVTVYVILRRNGVELDKSEIKDRHSKIIDFYNENHTLQETGDKFGITRERVRQILNKNGIKPRSSWFVPKVDKTLPLEKQFWLRVAITDNPKDCWPWLGGTNTKGYGTFGYKGKRYLTHVYSLSLKLGRPVEKKALHHCDNPPCCNPHHLFEGTAADNTRDMIAKGRAAFQANYDEWYRKMTSAQKQTNPKRIEMVIDIKKRLASGELMKHIAADYNLTIGAISHIKTGRTYKNVKIF